MSIFAVRCALLFLAANIFYMTEIREECVQMKHVFYEIKESHSFDTIGAGKKERIGSKTKIIADSNGVKYSSKEIGKKIGFYKWYTMYRGKIRYASLNIKSVWEGASVIEKRVMHQQGPACTVTEKARNCFSIVKKNYRDSIPPVVVVV